MCNPVVDEVLGVLIPAAGRAVFANSNVFPNTVTGESKEDTSRCSNLGVDDMSEI